MTSSAEAFQRELGSQIASLLGPRFKFIKSRLELRAATDDGDDVIVLSGSNKFSPHVSIAFYFGRNYALARKTEGLLWTEKSLYHIHQYSPNLQSSEHLAYRGPVRWDIDIQNPPPHLAVDIVTAINGIAVPFFKRFSTIDSARNALATDDPWCLGGAIFWRQLLLLDLTMGKQEHFERWAANLDEFQLGQAKEVLSRYRVAMQNAV